MINSYYFIIARFTARSKVVKNDDHHCRVDANLIKFYTVCPVIVHSLHISFEIVFFSLKQRKTKSKWSV